MDSHATFIGFNDYRDRMLSIMAMASANITAEPPANVDGLNLGRVRMSRTLTSYHLFAQRELFGPWALLGDPARRAHIRQLETECATLARDFREFSRDCEARPVLQRWSAYRTEALAMMARIRKHLQAAEAEVRYCQSIGIGRQPAQAA